MKKWLMLSVLLYAIFFVSACEAMDYSPPIIFKSTATETPKSFPAEVEIDYFVANGMEKIVSPDAYLAFRYKSNGKFWLFHVFPVEKTKDGFVVVGSEHQSYSIPKPEEFGYTGIYPIDKKNGSFTMQFRDEREYNSFFDYNGISEHIVGIDDICDYYGCTTEKDSKKSQE